MLHEHSNRIQEISAEDPGGDVRGRSSQVSANTGRAGSPHASARPAIFPCPCCGSLVQRETPIVDLVDNTITWRGGTVRLSPKRAEFAAALARDFNRFVSVPTIISRVYGPLEPIWPSQAVSKEFYRMRGALASIGLRVEGRPGTTTGLRMVAI